MRKFYTGTITVQEKHHHFTVEDNRGMWLDKQVSVVEHYDGNQLVHSYVNEYVNGRFVRRRGFVPQDELVELAHARYCSIGWRDPAKSWKLEE